MTVTRLRSMYLPRRAWTRLSSRAALASSSVANPLTHFGLLMPVSGSLIRITYDQVLPRFMTPSRSFELAAALDQRARALGEQLAASPEPWLARQLGILAPHASPLLREDYARRAAAAAAYREAAGITHPGQAIAPESHRGNPELNDMRRTAIRALEIREDTESMRRMTQGELEARILDGDRAVASAPSDVARELRLTVQAEADAWQQSADAEIRNDSIGSANAKALARRMAAQREQLQAANADYEKWAANTIRRREAGGKARAELDRRGLAQQTLRQRKPEAGGEPQTMVEWWRQLEADLAAIDRTIEHERQAAITAGKPWSPERNHQPEVEAVSELETVPEPTRKPMASPARMTRQPGLTGYLARPPRQPSVSLPKTWPERPEPSTPLISNEKLIQNPSTPCKPKPPTRQRSSCKSRRTGVAGK